MQSLTKVILDKNPVLRGERRGSKAIPENLTHCAPDTWTQLTPMHRLGDPEDLKGSAIYLASDVRCLPLFVASLICSLNHIPGTGERLHDGHDTECGWGYVLFLICIS